VFRVLAGAFGVLVLAVLATVGWAVTAAFDHSLASVLRDVTVAAGALCLASLVAFLGLKVTMDRSRVSRLRRHGMAVRADVRYVLDLTVEPERHRWANLEACLLLHLPNYGGTRASVFSGIVARDLADRLLVMSTCSVFVDPYRPHSARIFLDGTASLAAPATAYVALSRPTTQPSVSRLWRHLAEVDRIRTGGLPGLAKLVAADAQVAIDGGDLVVRLQAVVVSALGPQFLAVWRQRVNLSARPLLVAGAQLPCRLTGRDRHHVALDLPPEIDPVRPPLPQASPAVRAPRPPRSRQWWVTVAVSTVALTTLIGLVTYWIVSPATAGLPADTGLFTCDGTRYPDAAPYGGPAPHPIVIMIQGGYDQVGDQWAEFSPVVGVTPAPSSGADTGGPSSGADTSGPSPGADTVEPSAGTDTTAPAVGTAWNSDDVRTVQLIACARRISVGSSEVVECQYEDTIGFVGQSQVPIGASQTLSMYTGTFQIDLYELRTHRLLFTTTIVGSDPTCPQTLSDTVTELATQPTEEQLEGALNDFVNGP
jgi:hypothetical protein